MLPYEEMLAALGIVALTAYALLGIADYGGGVWDLLARGPRRREQQEAISEAIGPVWEANHVWLIFFAVILFSAYPPAFAFLSVALFLPFHFVLLGIVLRGAAFVFRSVAGRGDQWNRIWGRIFGGASAMTPVLLGVALGIVSTGAIRLVDGEIQIDSWVWYSPFVWVTGAITVTLAAYLAAVYLTMETRGQLREDFRRRALWASWLLAGLALIELPLMAKDAPHLWERFIDQGFVFLVLGVVFAIVSVALLKKDRLRLARLAAGAEAVMLLWGWAVAQRPYIVYPDLTVFNTAAPHSVPLAALCRV